MHASARLPRSAPAIPAQRCSVDGGQTVADYALLSALVVLVVYVAAGPLTEIVRPIMESIAHRLDLPF